ncbi:MAG: bifunctional (p)ppGpp synthetase/guanosine-3',5'-bis(diphosphate) 3'-pyrophosphohydrolase, partial [Lachnospiraceae bacterium]|nr:bifunctional (p)ppGpp synthetase/guanosine-3',5'-bis(diphosphate) 3'-pyrophosphohydrolase [Lachnospiraceae bacterium]
IQNGDRIEILTSQNSKGPSRDWLALVKSTQAKNKINQWFKQELKEDNIVKGKEMINAYCKAKAVNLPELMKPEYQKAILQKYGFHDWDSVMAAVGHGGLKEGQIINRMQELYDKDHKRVMSDDEVMAAVEESAKSKSLTVRSKNGIVVKGVHDVTVHFSKCCSPVPGDEIVGFVTRGRGISVHRTDCVNIINLSDEDRVRIIEAEWQVPEGEAATGQYFSDITIYANNRSGLLADISKLFTDKKIDILSINTRTSKQGIATMMITFYVSGRNELQVMIERLRSVPSVLDVQRTTG